MACVTEVLRTLTRRAAQRNHVYQRFKRSADRGVWWNVLYSLQRDKKLTMNVAMIDSTTFKVHRHGGGFKGGSKAKEKIVLE